MKAAVSKAVRSAIKGIAAWSFSRWQDYEKCPALAKYKHVEKLREPDNAAMANGSIVHSLAAQHIRGDLKKTPPELAKFKVPMAALQKAKARVEQEWAFNAAWEPTGWFAPDAWLRIKVDSFHLEVEKRGTRQLTTVVIVDHKTGREHSEHAQQRALYALGAFLMFPDAVACRAEHWYLDAGTKAVSSFKASELPTLQKQWEQRTRAMLNDVRFAPRPGSSCRWCHFRKENGGPCEY